ncbi:MAG: tetratricopeptide repeat protein [Acidobacteriia bacterium]|nr:tetratricopeptide repeat protein [Terriglobia bacterium]
MMRSIRSYSLVTGLVARRTCAVFAAAWALSPFSLAVCPPPLFQGSSPATQAVPEQDQREVTILEPGKPLESRIARGKKYGYKFELSQRQYAAVAIDCQGAAAIIRLLDTAGTEIDRSFVSAQSVNRRIEIVAETTGRYGVELENKSGPVPTETCTILLSEPRPASEKDHQLQQARTLAFKAEILSGAGKYPEALESAQKALELRQRELGPEDALVGNSLFTLGNVYLATADLPEAEAVYQRALKIQVKTTGPASDSIFKTLNNLGAVYAQKGEPDKAKLSLQRALEAGEKVFGAEAPALANSLVNLANVYDDEADYGKAITYYERAMAIAEKTFGPDYPGLATIVANLAGVYSEKGDYQKAESLGQRAVSILERTSGPEDRRLGVPLENLADAYRLEGAIDKAEPLYKRALKIFEKTQGPEHPLVADALTNLADIDHDRHDFATAEALYRRALAIREKKLGAGHPDVALSFDHLGTLFRDRGDFDRAEDFYRKALAIREKALGPEHPDVVNTLTNLSTLQMAGPRARASRCGQHSHQLIDPSNGDGQLRGSGRVPVAGHRYQRAQRRSESPCRLGAAEAGLSETVVTPAESSDHAECESCA